MKNRRRSTQYNDFDRESKNISIKSVDKGADVCYNIRVRVINDNRVRDVVRAFG